MAASRTKRPLVSGKSRASSEPAAPASRHGAPPENRAGAPRSAGPSRKPDRRVRRTRDALGDALVTLIQEQPFRSITVQQVLDRAHVSRSTFYSHFTGTHDLLLSDAEDFWEMMSSMLAKARDKSNRVAPVAEFFAHVAEWRKFISAVAAAEKLNDVMDLGEGYFARSIAARLEAMPHTRSLSASRRSALGQAYAAAMFGLLFWWLNHDTEASPAQMDEFFHRMVWSGIGIPPAASAPRASRQ